MSEYIPTFWASSDYGLRNKAMFPHSAVSVKTTTASEGLFNGQYDHVTEVESSVPIVQDPYDESLAGAYILYDALPGILNDRAQEKSGNPLIQHYFHSVFDVPFPSDSDVVNAEADPIDYMYIRRAVHGHPLYYYTVDLGNTGSVSVEDYRTPGYTTNFLSSHSGIAANAAGAVLFEEAYHHMDIPEIQVEGTYRYLRMFAHVTVDVQASPAEKRVFDLINFERENRELPPYSWNYVLYRATNRHSQDMADNEFLSHTGSDASEPGDRVDDSGWHEHLTHGLIAKDELPEDPGESGSVTYLPWWHTENVGRTIPDVDPLENPPHNIDVGTYTEVISQAEYEAMGQAEIIVALWMASTEGHREALLDENCGDWLDENVEGHTVTEEYPANEMAVSAIQGSDGAWYWAFLAGRRFWHFPGFGCVRTTPITDYVSANFSFAGSEEQYLDEEGFWIVPGEGNRVNIQEPHWFKRYHNLYNGPVEAVDAPDYWFGDKPENPVKKELEYFLI